MPVHILLGSGSDRPVAEKVTATLKRLSIQYKVDVASAHRTPARVADIVRASNADVFIAIAGLSAALPGTVAAHTLKPVIGVPVSGKVNLDSILAVVQMPPGVPVAAVGLDAGENAALLAAAILALGDRTLHEALAAYRKEAAAKIEADSAEVGKTL